MKIEHHEDGRVTLYYDDLSKTRTLRTPLDALFYHIHVTLGLVCNDRDGYFPLSAGFGKTLRLPPATVSRAKNGLDPIPEAWLYKMHAYSGISIAELGKIANMEPSIKPHPRKLASLSEVECQSLAHIENLVEAGGNLELLGYRVTRIVQDLQKRRENEETKSG